MATLYVTEYATLGVESGRGTPVWRGPKTATNNVDIAATSTRSAAFAAATNYIRIHADAICSVEIGGTTPTATNTPQATASARMAAGQTEGYAVTPGDKLAVIVNT